MWNKAIKGLCGVAGAVAGLFGEWPASLTALAAMMCVDYMTGVLAACAGRSDKTEGGGLSSKAGFIGIIRKGEMMLIVLLAALLDKTVGTDGAMFRSAATFYYIANEGISILENAGLLGVPFPPKLRRALESLRDEADRETEE